jgi:predicted esterase
LVERGVARSPQHIALFGRSAGGLLAASTALQWADHFGVVLLQAPFVDVLATMTDALAPWTVFEWQEWGDPLTDATIAAQMYNYSPYSLAQRMSDAPSCFGLPIMLQTGLRDAIVRYYEHARLAGQMRSSLCDAGALSVAGDRLGPRGRLGRSCGARPVGADGVCGVAHRARAAARRHAAGSVADRRAGERSDDGDLRVLRCRRQRPNVVKV